MSVIQVPGQPGKYEVLFGNSTIACSADVSFAVCTQRTLFGLTMDDGNVLVRLSRCRTMRDKRVVVGGAWGLVHV